MICNALFSFCGGVSKRFWQNFQLINLLILYIYKDGISNQKFYSSKATQNKLIENPEKPHLKKKLFVYNLK